MNLLFCMKILYKNTTDNKIVIFMLYTLNKEICHFCCNLVNELKIFFNMHKT